MPKRKHAQQRQILIAFLLLLVVPTPAPAQTTGFTYQGELSEGGDPADGTYDFQFSLFDTVSGGAQIGTMVARNATAVSGGLFTVQLDFGTTAFPGANRFLEIAVRPSGGGSFTTLSPRQQISSTPYAIRTLSAATADGLSSACVGCVQSAQIASVAGPKITGQIPVASLPTGSGSYIQNGTAQQSGASFNIAGSGAAGSLSLNGPMTMAGAAPPAVAPAGQARLFYNSATNRLRLSENGGAYVDLLGASGVSGSGTASTLALWSAGTTLGNSAISQSGGNVGIGGAPAHRLAVLGGPGWTGDNWGGALELDNASAIGWRANASNVKFGIGRTNAGLFFFRTNSALGSTADAPIYDLKMDNAGNVGIGNLGISTDLSVAKLSVHTASGQFGLAQTDGTTTVAAGVVSAGGILAGGYFGTRSNHPLQFFTNDGFPSMTLDTAGNVGIGRANPAHRLSLSGGPLWTTNGWRGAIELDNAAAIGWRGNASGNRFGIGQTNGGLYFFATGSDPGTTGGQAITSLVINDAGTVEITGNATQARNRGGWAKAMVYVNGDGTILRCYNGQTGSSSGDCGFTTGRLSNSGDYWVDFGFRVSDRFYSSSVDGGCCSKAISVHVGPLGDAAFLDDPTHALRILVFDNDASTTDRPVSVIVY